MSLGDQTPFLERSAVGVCHFLVPNSDLSHAVVIRLLKRHETQVGKLQPGEDPERDEFRRWFRSYCPTPQKYHSLHTEERVHRGMANLVTAFIHAKM